MDAKVVSISEFTQIIMDLPDTSKLRMVEPRGVEDMTYSQMIDRLPICHGVYIRDPWPTLDQARKENPDCIVYGCIHLYPQFNL